MWSYLNLQNTNRFIKLSDSMHDFLVKNLFNYIVRYQPPTSERSKQIKKKGNQLNQQRSKQTNQQTNKHSKPCIQVSLKQISPINQFINIKNQNIKQNNSFNPLIIFITSSC
ncbi:hypothetical protein ABPG72_013916 [Tetrahymena utriculariae]